MAVVRVVRPPSVTYHPPVQLREPATTIPTRNIPVHTHVAISAAFDMGVTGRARSYTVGFIRQRCAIGRIGDSDCGTGFGAEAGRWL